MRVQISPEQQIQRINLLEQYLNELEGLSLELLRKRNREKSWSVVEVVKHMSIGHSAYRTKISSHMSSGSKVHSDKYRASAIPSFLIKRFPPQKEKIRFKMKTSKKFEPLLEHIDESVTAEVFGEFKASLNELKDWIESYRLNGVNLSKFNSAVGPIVKFNVPEACEFILCHNERHTQQIKNILV